MELIIKGRERGRWTHLLPLCNLTVSVPQDVEDVASLRRGNSTSNSNWLWYYAIRCALSSDCISTLWSPSQLHTPSLRYSTMVVSKSLVLCHISNIHPLWSFWLAFAFPPIFFFLSFFFNLVLSSELKYKNDTSGIQIPNLNIIQVS